MRRSPPVAWYEFLPAGAALAASLTSLASGIASPAILAPPLALAVLYPLWLAAAQRLAQQQWTPVLRHFLPLLLLVPMYFILSAATHPEAPRHLPGSPPLF